MSDPQDDVQKESEEATAGPSDAKIKSFPELGHETLQDFIKVVYKDIVQTTVCSNSLPAVTEDWEYWESFGKFKDVCAKQGSRILENIGNILQHRAVQCKWGTSHLTTKSSADIEDQFEKLVDANDFLLESVGSLLDEAAGIKKKGEEPIIMTSTLKTDSPAVSSWNKKKDFLKKSAPYKLLMAKNIHRPQLNWLDKIDNRNIPFVPFLKYKHNALKPMEESRNDNIDDVNQDDLPCSLHPYHYELSQFEPNEWQLDVQTPRMYLPLDDTPLTIVDSQDLLDEMMEKLRQVKEIVIDLEHHNYRSFQGIVCLIQISTRKEDFIIDSLKLRQEELCVLNEVFTDPSILKVLHGSDADIGWLQRDFGVYMVNMFDTGQAARTLQEARFSLAHLLQKYCNVTAQKQYQLADWRIRPLPAEMIRYAREDTHYLLYVYDVLRNELISRGNELKNLLRMVYTKSTDLCASLYQKQLCQPDSYLHVYKKYRKKFNPQQMECFRVIYHWRDKIARQEDESTGYVLPNHMLFQIAENLPRDQEGIIACCNPVPPLVNQHVADIVRLVTDARFYDPEEETNEPSDNRVDFTTVEKIQSDKDVEKFQTGSYDPRSGFEIYPIVGPKIQSKEPAISLFEVIIKEQLEANAGKKKAKEFMEMLKSPFEMYLPNTGKSPVDPKEINSTWQTASREKLAEEEAPSQVLTPAPEPAPAEEFLPVSESTIGKKKRRKHHLDDDEKTLRELLPKKSRMPKPLDEHLNDMLQGGTMPENMPVKLDYDKNIGSSSDFVPFDYSKADLKKFNAAKAQTNANVNLDQTEEPNFKGPIKTKVHSGARQMSF